ncbi:DUF3060 domain-containing protein [Mycolicibacterium vaccae]|uniref:DUF3060 domain-containing protein n=1 Tax=Mycolicibacterium vaccae TaxID=1810 RepID=UPI003CEB47C8
MSGVDNVVEVTGSCASVSVSGVRDVLTVESATSIPRWSSQARATWWNRAEPVGAAP